MRLRAQRPCSVLIGDLGLRVEFAAGEELRTEISAKFTPERAAADLPPPGSRSTSWLTDDENCSRCRSPAVAGRPISRTDG